MKALYLRQRQLCRRSASLRINLGRQSKSLVKPLKIFDKLILMSSLCFKFACLFKKSPA